MILNVLISTIDSRILGLKKIIKEEKDVIYTVSHQISDTLSEKVQEYVAELHRYKYVVYSPLYSVGVAKNRNNALKHRVKGAICLLADDDIVYYPNSFSTIRQLFQEDNTLDFLTFKIKTFSGKDYKNYKSYAFQHTLKTLSIIGIVDVAFKEEVIDKYGLKFDERFGPGGKYSIGEDFIFMTDAVKKDAKICYKPIDIVQHEDMGTGMILKDNIIFGRGAMFARVFGWLSFPLNMYFALKNRKKYVEVYTFTQYARLLFAGSWNYLGKKF